MSSIQLDITYPRPTLSERIFIHLKHINKIECAAFTALTAFLALYSIPVSLLSLGSYLTYQASHFHVGQGRINHFLCYHPTDLNLTEQKPIEMILSEELALAKKHMATQKQRSWFSCSFSRLSDAPCSFEIHDLKTILPSRQVGIAHAQGMRPTQEDTHIAFSGQTKTPQVLDYDLFGIIDGHGGDTTAKFVSTHLQEELEQAILKHGISDHGIQTALKEAFVRLDAKIASEIDNFSGAAAIISLKIGHNLWTANLGDCRAILKIGNTTIQLSEDAKPDTPRFKQAIEERGGWVEEVAGVPRINGVLACARAFGDKTLRGVNGHFVVSPMPTITKIDLSIHQNQAVYLIQACDGIWDVASSKEVASMIGRQLPEKDAAAIVRAALNAGSSDNCSALVTRLT